MIPLDRGKLKKTKLSTFSPVSVLNTFSKVYERAIKEQIACGIEKYFTVFICVQEKLELTKHLNKSYERRKNVDNNFLVGRTLTDLSKASTTYHTIC